MVWFSTWLLDFNAGKCVVLKVKKKHNYVYTLNGIALKEVEHQKRSWHSHFQHIVTLETHQRNL